MLSVRDHISDRLGQESATMVMVMVSGGVLLDYLNSVRRVKHQIIAYKQKLSPKTFGEFFKKSTYENSRTAVIPLVRI